MPQSTIHWHEGLFLRPQHFQLLDRQINERFGFERGLAWAYPYGVIESKLSHDDLENFRVRFDRLEVVMPDGAVISYPDNAELASLDIREAFASNPKGFTVYLALPIWLGERGNVLDSGEMEGARVKTRYRVARETLELPDENSGQNAQPVQVRRYNAMLILDEDDDGDLEKIPLFRVIHDTSHEEPFPRQDPNFVYPSLHLSASPTLREMVKEIFAQVAAVREQLANVVARGSESATMGRLQIQQILRLRSLNGFVSRLPALIEVGEGSVKVPPLDIYLELRGLLGELMALFPERGEFTVVPYRHEDPYPSFQAVITQIRNYLHGAVAPDYMKVSFEDEDEGVKVAKLEDKHFSEPTAYFLGIKTSVEPSRLVELVEDTDQFKLMPRSYLERAIRGVSLKEERFPPLELPADTGRYYFRLQTTQSRRIWEEVVREMELVVRWSQHKEMPDLDITLFMTTSPAAAK